MQILEFSTRLKHIKGKPKSDRASVAKVLRCLKISKFGSLNMVKIRFRLFANLVN